MENYFKQTTDAINNYNYIIDKISSCTEETTDVEDEYLSNFGIYLAHALLKDYGFGASSIAELIRVAKIIIIALDGWKD